MDDSFDKCRERVHINEIRSLCSYFICRDCTPDPSHRRKFISHELEPADEPVQMIIVTRIDDSFRCVLWILILSTHICAED
jgi:hypothetical protein